MVADVAGQGAKIVITQATDPCGSTILPSCPMEKKNISSHAGLPSNIKSPCYMMYLVMYDKKETHAK
jgi:hypothetical protein